MALRRFKKTNCQQNGQYYIIEAALASYIQPHKNIQHAHVAFVTFGMATVKKGFKLQVLA